MTSQWEWFTEEISRYWSNGSNITKCCQDHYCLKPSILFDVPAQVLSFKFQHWRWIPHSLSDSRNVTRVDGANLLRQEFLNTKKRSWNLFWTGDEFWMLWSNERSEFWLAVDQELPVRMKWTIGTRKSMLTVLCQSQNLYRRWSPSGMDAIQRSILHNTSYHATAPAPFHCDRR
jgi:hypothetical protein